MPTSFFAVVANDGSISAQGQRADGTVPPGATAVSEDHYNTIVASPGQCRMVNGVLLLTALPALAPPDLGAFKDAALLQVDTAAEATRQLFLTAGAGQVMEYQATEAEAVWVLAQPPGAALNPADYPWLGAETAALASVGQVVPLLAVAGSVQDVMNGWRQAGVAIKAIRRAAKLQIGAASTMAQVHAILDGLRWPAPP